MTAGLMLLARGGCGAGGDSSRGSAEIDGRGGKGTFAFDVRGLPGGIGGGAAIYGGRGADNSDTGVGTGIASGVGGTGAGSATGSSAAATGGNTDCCCLGLGDGSANDLPGALSSATVGG